MPEPKTLTEEQRALVRVASDLNTAVRRLPLGDELRERIAALADEAMTRAKGAPRSRG